MTNKLGINLYVVVVFCDKTKHWKWSVYKDIDILVKQNYSVTSKQAYRAGNNAKEKLDAVFDNLIDIHE